MRSEVVVKRAGMQKLIAVVLLLALSGMLTAQAAQGAQSQTSPSQSTPSPGQASTPSQSTPSPAQTVGGVSGAGNGAANGGTSVIYGTGTVFVNGGQLTNSGALMTGDVVQTKDDGAANISLPGSSVVVDSNSIVRTRGEGFSLDRGSISVATGRGLSVYARDFKITPVDGGEWTQYYVTRSSGTIGIIARKNAVTVECGSRTETVREGQQLSKEDAESCGLMERAKGAPAAAKGPILTSTKAEWTALAAGAALAAYGLAHDDDPVSPAKP